MRFRIVTTGVILATVLGARWSEADDRADEARALGARAVTAAEAGDLVGAVALFKQARAIDDRAEYLCNIGVAYHRLDDLPRAHLFLSECLVRAGAIDARAAAGFRGLLDEVEAALRAGAFAVVDVTVTPRGALVGASIFADDERAPGPRIVWLPRGRHTVRAEAPGYRAAEVEIEVAPGDTRRSVALELVRPSTVPEPAQPPPPSVPPTPPPRSRTPALVTLGAGGVGLAAGVFFHLQALDTRDDIAANFRYAGPERDRRESTWRRQVGAMAAGYGVAAIAGGVGAYLWWRAGRGGPVVAPAGVDRVTVRWRF